MAKKQLEGCEVHQQYFTSDGMQVPGVTTISGRIPKPHLYKWANNLGLEKIAYDAYMDMTASIGSAVHGRIEAWWKGESFDTTHYTEYQLDYAEFCFDKFLDWEKDNEVKPVMLETPLVSEKYGYGGTMDFLGYINGKLTIMDYKTGGRIYQDMGMQLSALRQLVRENGHGNPQVCAILRLGRDGVEGWEFGQFPNEALNIQFERFQLLLRDYKLENTLGKPAFYRTKQPKAKKEKIKEVIV